MHCMDNWREIRLAAVCAFLLCAIAACSEKTTKSPEAAGVNGELAKAGAYLAYEHKIQIRFEEDTVAAHLDSVRKACVNEQFGQCSLIAEKRSSGNYPGGEITVRVAPASVEPLVKLAAETGRIWLRETRGDDLADVVGNTSNQRELLTRQRGKLEELQARKDTTVADQLTLSRELAALEVALDSTEKEAGKQRRRIETNLLTINFEVDKVGSRAGKLGQAITGLWDSFVDGLTEALGMLSYGLPFLSLAFPIALLWRWLWRRVTRKGA